MTGDREGIIRLATEYMGWKAKRDRDGRFYGAFDYTDSDGRNCTRYHFNPFASSSDARQVESAIPEAKRDAYVRELWAIAAIESRGGWKSQYAGYWYIAHATPRQRSQAALAVLTEAQG